MRKQESTSANRPSASDDANETSADPIDQVGGPSDAGHEPQDDENTSEGRYDPANPPEIRRDSEGKPIADRRG